MSPVGLSTSQLNDKIEGEVLDDDYTLGMYATDASIYQIKPLMVVLPKNENDVKKAHQFANENKLKILPRGGGTSLAGQTVGEAMVLDFSKYMNRVLEINAEEKWARVQPGVVRDELNKELEPFGLHFAPDPATSSRANIGGMVGNNSSGTKSILYGKTVDHIIEAKILLADGTELVFNGLDPEEYKQKCQKSSREGAIYNNFKDLIDQNREEIEKRFPKVMRRVGGYNFDEFINTNHWNLAKLITGSEGTLATTLEVKINLEPLPKHKSVCVVHFAELLEAIKAVKPMLDYQPAAIEILDHTVLQLSRENLTTKHHCHFLENDPAAILIVEFYGDTEEEVLRRPKEMIGSLKQQGFGYAYPLFPEGKSYDDVWVVRKKGLGLMLGLKGKKKPLPFIEDAGIPVDDLPEYIEKVLQICKKHNTEAAMYAHASVGVIHVRPILDLRQKEDVENLRKIADETFELVMHYGGSWSGEHGDGLVRSYYNERFFGPKLYQAFKDVKKLFDPENIMNPWKIVDAPSIENNLRYGSQYHDQEIKTTFHYRSETSFGDAVHMCTGVGECRKMLGGTMCPSFKATRDEEHSTRGRANALRLAMSGQLDEAGFTSKRLHQVLDLCLSCKACKSECPSNVDMAKLKSETLQMYYNKHGLSIRDRMIRDTAKAASTFAGVFAPVVNAFQNSKIFRGTIQNLLGFHPKRKLPEYTREPFFKWFAKQKNLIKSEHKVALFADTYINYHEPEIGKGAVELLNSCGYEVLLAHVGCCQRPKISHGLLDRAKKYGMHTVQGLKPYLEVGIPVLVCEPSCASALNDDLPDLIDDEIPGNQLKEQVMMIEGFIAREIEAGNLKGDFESLIGNFKFHGHCHQKALYGTNPLKTIFNKTGCEVSEIPSGCCGMAGSFGYEKEHYEISQKIGEMELFPAVRAMGEKAKIVASGFSCRHQVEHFTGVKPRHWVEVIRAKNYKHQTTNNK